MALTALDPMSKPDQALIATKRHSSDLQARVWHGGGCSNSNATVWTGAAGSLKNVDKSVKICLPLHVGCYPFHMGLSARRGANTGDRTFRQIMKTRG